MSRNKNTGEHSWPEEEKDWDDLFDVSENSPFHIGQECDEYAAPVVVCKLCGGQEFNVGSSAYFTAIRCVKCQWETVIHTG